MPEWGIDGRTALVTGAAQGIGEAVARQLAEAGASVAAVDLHADRLDVLAAEAAEKGWTIAAYPADVRDRTAVEDVVDRVEADLGPISVLANVAGVLRLGAVTDLTDADWADSFDVNATGVFLLSRAVGARMAARGAGSIVTVGSNAAGIPRMRMAAYAASKAAATAFTKCLGLELAGAGVRCNVVSPGSTDTPMQRSMWRTPDDADAVLAGDPASYKVGIPLGRLADPADVADAVCFLASDRARHITMHDLYVDGGATLR